MEIRPYLSLQGNAGSALSAGGDYAGWKLGVYSGIYLKLGLDLDFGIVDGNSGKKVQRSEHPSVPSTYAFDQIIS